MSQEFILCPYDLTHVILKSRMPSHLIKCRKQHKCEKFVTCPLNSTHDIPEPELEYHVRICPDRKNLEGDVYLTEEPRTVDPRSMEVELPTFSENWDEETCPAGSYLNVKESVVGKHLVLRQPVGKSKSEKREFYKKEFQKFRDSQPSGSGKQ